MKKFTLFLLLVFFAGGTQSQIFTDDFESYTLNAYLGVASPDWTTWSGATGGPEDVRVTNTNPSSGAQSIYFSSNTTGGGPQDVVLPFANQYTSGIFVFQADFLVETGKGAYFNFQATPVIGTTWALNCWMYDNGTIDLEGLAGGPIPIGSWFTLRIEANLTLGLWQYWIDGVLGGNWSNPVNSVASIDIFPLMGHGFYVDDVSYDHAPYTLPALNAGVSGIDMVGNVAGQSVYPTVKFRNVGQNSISSVDVSLNYNGTQLTENVTGLSLASMADYVVEFGSPVTLVGGMNNAVAIVSNVNGMGQDGDANDDTLSSPLNPVVPAIGKVVVGEEATGTWCQWCPRGAVFMDKWSEKYDGYFAGIAVHNGDPMTEADYDAAISSMVPGYPSALVDRNGDVDPSAMSPQIASRLQIPPVATILNGAAWNASTRELTVSLTTTFQSAVTGDYRLACVLTEDSVVGSGAGWDQANTYSGGGNGPMGGYELLPNPVPANLMVYDHVARAISPGFDGLVNSFPASVPNGAVYSSNFTFTLTPGWDINKMHIVGMVIAPDSLIDNAGYTTVNEAIANGLGIGFEVEGSTLFDGPDIQLYPNPSHGTASLSLGLKDLTEVSVSIYDATGRLAGSRNYGTLSGAQILPIHTTGLAAGLYSVSISLNGNLVSKKLIVE